MKNVLLSKSTKLTLLFSLLFFACSTKASAEVNTKVLNSVIKSCQDNPPKDNSLFKIPENTTENCVESRYNYTLWMSQYNGLKNLGDLRPGFPSSLAIYYLARNGFFPQQFLDCMVSKNTGSNECFRLFVDLRDYSWNHKRSLGAVCSSCFEAYLSADSNWSESMIKDLINWFYGLDKPSRKLVVDSFSNENFLKALRSEGFEASQLYLKIKDKVERETQQQKRRDLLN